MDERDATEEARSTELTELMDTIPGSYERLLAAREDLREGRTGPLAELAVGVRRGVAVFRDAALVAPLRPIGRSCRLSRAPSRISQQEGTRMLAYAIPDS